MEKQYQYFTYKFQSARLKEFDYNIKLKFNEAKENNEVIALFDNQIIRSINRIQGREVDMRYVGHLYEERNKIRRYKHSEDNVNKIKELQDKINTILHVPEYITIVMNHSSHYKYLYENGLFINGEKYVRFNSSASQARVSTVTFCSESVIEQLNKVMDNGRNKKKGIVPSKLNAYKGLAGSSTQVVTTPKYCIVPDYESETTYKAHKVTETDWQQDDILNVEDVTEQFNRFDGQGLVSIRQAEKWAEELGLDYIPAQWCIRQNYMKGMLCTFDIHKFCEEENKQNYIIETSYKDEEGNPRKVNLKDIDVIISESQAKLWDSWDSQEDYDKNCEENGLEWGVTLYTPKQDKDILTMNYQFLQTLNLDKNDIKKVSEQFVDWVSGVASNNVYYTLLFLLGENVTQERIDKLLSEKEKNHWLKSLFINHNLINDKYIKRKAHDMIKRKIQRACLGDIIVDGNFQVIVSDPYAQMQHVCGQEVTGLLKKGEYYSGYWNKKSVKTVDSMRSPLTYRSEHVVLDFIKNEQTEEWYKYCYTGIILNAHGSETVNYAGSDFDYDIIATTSNETIIKGVYRDELPVVYDPPSSEKIVLEDDKPLFEADLFSFGSIIGSITNKSTSGYALLTDMKEESEEYNVTLNRIRMCTKLQSAQIDKAKIGRAVKGIPKNWIDYQKHKDDDAGEVKETKDFLNSIRLDKHPYFFTYLYPDTKRKYDKHYKKYDISCKQKFALSLDDLMKKERRTPEQIEFLELYHEFSPVIESDCVMNNLCRYIESVDFEIKNIVKTSDKLDHSLLFSKSYSGIDDDLYNRIVSLYEGYRGTVSQYVSIREKAIRTSLDEATYNEITESYSLFKDQMTEVCSEEEKLVDYLIYMFYVDDKKYNKDIIWKLYGEQVFENIKGNIESYNTLEANENGELKYLGKRYSIRKVDC